MDQFWAVETERRRVRRNGWIASTVGGSGMLGTVLLFAEAINAHFLVGAPADLVTMIAAGATGMSSLWLTKRGLTGLRNSRPPEPPARVALETALTVDEAQHKLSELAEKGHPDVRVEGSKLVYSL